LAQAGLINKLFERFGRHLEAAGYIARDGQIIDATIVPVPKQRNTKEENEAIKAGKTPQGWEQQPAKHAQKDKDARWTKKNDAANTTRSKVRARVEHVIRPAAKFEGRQDRAHHQYRAGEIQVRNEEPRLQHPPAGPAGADGSCNFNAPEHRSSGSNDPEVCGAKQDLVF
jgi:hypothetical protein